MIDCDWIHILCIFKSLSITGELEWPEEEEWMVGEDAEDLIKALLQKQPEVRLGSGGATEVKQHHFLTSVDWNGLLRQKTQFVPDLSGEDDTSYFDGGLCLLSMMVLIKMFKFFKLNFDRCLVFECLFSLT